MVNLSSLACHKVLAYVIQGTRARHLLAQKNFGTRCLACIQDVYYADDLSASVFRMLICHRHMLRDSIVSVCFILAGRKGEAILSIGADHLPGILIQIKSIWRWKDFVAAGICVLEALSVLCGLWWEWSVCSSPFICVPLTAHRGCPVRSCRKNFCCYLPKTMHRDMFPFLHSACEQWYHRLCQIHCGNLFDKCLMWFIYRFGASSPLPCLCTLSIITTMNTTMIYL